MTAFAHSVSAGETTATWGVPVLRLPPAGLPLAPYRSTRYPPVAIPAPAQEDVVTIARYRWIVGHHAAFLAWRTIGRALRRLMLGPDPAQVRAVARGFDAYSVLLLYSGSCSSHVYALCIRPAMMLAHPAFSGRWAPDYEEVPELLRQARRRLAPVDTADLVTAVRRNHLAHAAVARRLVPDGVSLLKDAGHDRHVPATEDEKALFDQFFLVERGPVGPADMQRQLIGVLRAIDADLRLRPIPTDDPGEPHAHDLAPLKVAGTSVLDGFLRGEIDTIH